MNNRIWGSPGMLKVLRASLWFSLGLLAWSTGVAVVTNVSEDGLSAAAFLPLIFPIVAGTMVWFILGRRKLTRLQGFLSHTSQFSDRVQWEAAELLRAIDNVTAALGTRVTLDRDRHDEDMAVIGEAIESSGTRLFTLEKHDDGECQGHIVIDLDQFLTIKNDEELRQRLYGEKKSAWRMRDALLAE